MKMKVAGKIWIAVLLTWASLGVACGGPSRTTVDVFVATSLAEAFEIFETRYERENPLVDIRLNVAGSSTLVRQINAGGDVDVFVPADARILIEVDQQAASEPSTVATNRLTIIVPRTRDDVTSIDDLRRDDIVVSRCASGVPCGDATDAYLERTGITLHAASEHTNVGGVVGQVVAGDVAAGFVYETDALRASGSARSIPLDDAPTVEPVIVTFTTQTEAAAFVEYVLSSSGRAVMTGLGFGEPATSKGS